MPLRMNHHPEYRISVIVIYIFSIKDRLCFPKQPGEVWPAFFPVLKIEMYQAKYTAIFFQSTHYPFYCWPATHSYYSGSHVCKPGNPGIKTVSENAHRSRKTSEYLQYRILTGLCVRYLYQMRIRSKFQGQLHSS